MVDPTPGADQRPRAAGTGSSSRTLRLLTGVPMVLLLVGLIGFAAAEGSGWVRDQLRASFTQQRPSFLALSFPDGLINATEDACTIGAATVPVTFQMTAYGERPRRVQVATAIAPDFPVDGPQSGTTAFYTVVPGKPQTITVSLAATSQPWTVRVDLLGTRQYLSVRCPGAR